MAHTPTTPEAPLPDPPAAQRGAVLELRDAEPERPFLTFRGERYHFRLQSDLSLQQLALLTKTGKSMEQLAGAVEDPEALAAVGRDVRTGVELAMHDMPAGVQEQLTEGECIAILRAFTDALPAEASPVAPSQTTPPASPASTPAPTPNGS